jgi:hypothetical protein
MMRHRGAEVAFPPVTVVENQQNSLRRLVMPAFKQKTLIVQQRLNNSVKVMPALELSLLLWER